MNGPREVDVDELFDRNSDSRLLERRRSEELGLPPLVNTTPAPRFGPESMVGEVVPLPAPRGAMLRVGVRARPDRELIPGAVVTIVAEVTDEGDADADDVRLRVAIPPEAEAVDGSFTRDEVALDGDALLGEGLRVGTVPAGGAIRVRFVLRILPGTGPLDIGVHAAAPGVPAIAAPALRLGRRTGHTAYDATKPFFELEPGELADEPGDEIADELVDAHAGRAGAEPAAAHHDPPPEPPRSVDHLVDEPLIPAVLPIDVEFEAGADGGPEPPPEHRPAAEFEPETDIEPEPEPAAEPDSQLAPEPVPEHALAWAAGVDTGPSAPPEAPPAHSVLARILDADEVRALERVFSGAVPHGLAALALLSSVAAADAPLGRALGVADFARAVAAALPRALVAARMNRPTPPVVTQAALDAIRADGEPAEPEAAYAGPLLVARLDARELGSLRTLLARTLDDPFLRGSQVLLALAPRALEGVDDAVAAPVRDALAAYRVAAGAWLMRVTVRRAVDRRYDPLTADDATLHEAGRAVVAALRGAIG